MVREKSPRDIRRAGEFLTGVIPTTDESGCGGEGERGDCCSVRRFGCDRRSDAGDDREYGLPRESS